MLFGGLLAGAAYFVLLERRMAAWVQDRRGPNRVGIPLTQIRLFGLGQPMADGLKMILKEEYTPAHVDRRLYIARAADHHGRGPGRLRRDSLRQRHARRSRRWGSIEPIPLVVAPRIDVGMIYVFALSSIAVYGVILGGWASNNKYSFLGGLRSSAQLISYELPLGLGILGVVLATGSLRLDEIIQQQAEHGLVRLAAAAGLRRLRRGRLRRGGSAAVRPARMRAGTGRRLPHRVLRHEAGAVPDGRVHSHDHGVVPDRDPVPRRLALSGDHRQRQ